MEWQSLRRGFGLARSCRSGAFSSRVWKEQLAVALFRTWSIHLLDFLSFLVLSPTRVAVEPATGPARPAKLQEYCMVRSNFWPLRRSNLLIYIFLGMSAFSTSLDYGFC